MGRVNGKTALITGAGIGLGRASALLLAREGARIAVTDIDVATGQDTAEAIRAKGGEAAFFAHDVTDPAQWQSVLGEAEARYGRLDVLVNNAGIAVAKNVEETTLDEWRRTMAVNADGVFLGCKFGIPALRRAGGGSIVNLSSIDGIIGEADLAAYCASKGAVRTLTKAVAVHCAEQQNRIRCNSIHPGYVWTAQTESYFRDRGQLDEEREKALRRHPIGYLGEPEDVAFMVLYLASDESKFVTGAEMVVDGGYLMV